MGQMRGASVTMILLRSRFLEIVGLLGRWEGNGIVILVVKPITGFMWPTLESLQVSHFYHQRNPAHGHVRQMSLGNAQRTTHGNMPQVGMW